jgi:glycosyltransferase involved in cell wall biosynthesis
MKKPLFSIIIPTLNEEKNLPKLLKDLQKQTFSQFDVWVIDGKSDDKTQEIAQKYVENDPRFHLFVSNRRNVGHQRNFGSQKSTGEYVIFFDADNRLPDHYLAEIHKQCVKKEIFAFTTWAQPDTENSQDKIIMNMLNMVIEVGAKVGAPSALGACIGCRRSVFEIVGGFDPSISFMEDMDLIQRIVKKGYQFSVFRTPLFTYSFRRMRKEGTLQLCRKMVPYFIVKQVFNQKTTKPLDIYPMLGGGYYSTTDSKQKTKSKSLLQIMEFEKIIRKMNQNLIKKFLSL